MVFSSVIFLFAFLPMTLLGYYICSAKYKNYFLLGASFVFYAWGEPEFVWIMIISVFFNWMMTLLMCKAQKKARKKLIVAIAVLFDLLLLFMYKYAKFATQNITFITGRSISLFDGIRLPIGISFYTFQAISYVVDVYRGDGEVQKKPLNVALYIMLFPQLIAGPIVRYRTIADEIKNRKCTLMDFSEGIVRFVVGLGKKAIIANALAMIADTSFQTVETPQMNAGLAWVGAIAYALQIYYDFSGYSDMAIGLGRMFGFHFSENFNYPYCSSSVSEFWRRWHISLGSWFRDYVYIPLGGSRKGPAKTVRNLLIVWFLTGLWHGANWTFVVWGLTYFIFIALEKVCTPKKKLFPSVLMRILTAFIVLLEWVLFRADSISQAAHYYQSMLSPMVEINMLLFYIKQYGLLLLVSAVGTLPVIPWIRNKMHQSEKGIMVYSLGRMLAVAVVGIMSIACVISSTYNPFIYFNF